MDTVTRMIGQRLNVAWGQPIVVDDRVAKLATAQ